jgi:methylphosphotriester-DNA--protein-cysteine methyltransferase
VTENDIRILLLRQVALFGGKEALADALGMSKQNLHRFLNGTQGLRHHKVLDALGLETAMVRVLKPKTDI